MRPALLAASERRPANDFLPERVKDVLSAPVPTYDLDNASPF